MLDFEAFVDIALMLDDLNRCCSSRKEIAVYAYDYWSDFQASKNSICAVGCIPSLLDVLEENALCGDEDCEYWRDLIISEISD